MGNTAAVRAGITPFFIVCSGRSGSTLLSSMLNMHTALHVPVELESLYLDLPQRLPFYGDLKDPFRRRLLARDLARTGHMGAFDTPFDTALFERNLTASGQYDLHSVISAFYRTLLAGSGKRRLGDKTPGYMPRFRWLRELFPEARIIHLVRDGRDCALSAMAWRSGINYRNLDELARGWDRLNSDLATFAEARPDLCLTVHYEDLVDDTETTLQRVCFFLGERFEPAMLDYAEGSFSRENAARLAHHGNLSQGILQGNHGKWRQGMTATQIAIYEAAAGPALARNGYPVTGTRRGLRGRLTTVRMRCATTGRFAARRARRAHQFWRFRLAVAVKTRLRVLRLGDVTRSLRREHP